MLSRPTRPGTSDAHAKSRRKRPLHFVDTSDFESRQTADAKGGPRLRQDATDERTPDDGVKNTRRDDLPSVAESVQAYAGHGRARKMPTHGWREDTARHGSSFCAAYREVSIKELARAWRISPKALYDIINRQRSTESAAALRRPGPAHLLTDADAAVLAELSEELDGEYTWEEMTERFNKKTGKNVSKMTVFRFCKSRGWREVCDKYVPCLTSADVKARREWAEQHVNYA